MRARSFLEGHMSLALSVRRALALHSKNSFRLTTWNGTGFSVYLPTAFNSLLLSGYMLLLERRLLPAILHYPEGLVYCLF